MKQKNKKALIILGIVLLLIFNNQPTDDIASLKEKKIYGGYDDFEDMKKEALKDKSFKKEWDALELEYQVIRALIRKRLDKKMSQRKLAKIAKTHQSAIARLESGKASPTLSVVSRLLAELGAKVSIK